MMGDLSHGVLFAAAVIAAWAAGWFSWQGWCSWRRRVRHRSALIQHSNAPEGALFSAKGDTSLEARIISYAVGIDKRLSSALFHPMAPAWLRERPCNFEAVVRAGLKDRLSCAAFWESRVRMTLAITVLCAVLGAVVSTELGVLLAVVGLMAGWRALPWALTQRSSRRAEHMERHLSEMLDVVAMGMRSGMSFDRSLQLYTEHFHSLLADSFARAHRQWSCGLASRADALREVASSYASPLLDRVVENIIRSLRFGATLADNLEDAAREARATFRARKQEQVAKAPVKMMVPTGVLILPAMLMLVLGPVLLELAGGF